VRRTLLKKNHVQFFLTYSYLDILDGGMVTIAMFTYNFFHPGCLLPEDTSGQDGYAGKESPGLDA